MKNYVVRVNEKFLFDSFERPLIMLFWVHGGWVRQH